MPTKPQHTGVKIAAAGAAALAAAAATAYYFAFDKGAKKHRQTAKDWASKAKTEVITELKKLKTFTKPAYEGAVKEVLKKYGEYEKTAPGEISKLQKDLMSQWGKISTYMQSKAKPVKKDPVKKSAKSPKGHLGRSASGGKKKQFFPCHSDPSRLGNAMLLAEAERAGFKKAYRERGIP